MSDIQKVGHDEVEVTVLKLPAGSYKALLQVSADAADRLGIDDGFIVVQGTPTRHYVFFDWQGQPLEAGFKPADPDEQKRGWECLRRDPVAAAFDLVRQAVGKHRLRNDVTLDGRPVCYAAAEALMDDGLREELHGRLAPCSDQTFIDAYAAAHAARFGESFEAA